MINESNPSTKTRHADWLWLLGLLFLFPMSLMAAESDKWKTSEFLPGRLIVNFDASVNLDVSTRNPDNIILVDNPDVDSLFARYAVRSCRRWIPDGILNRLKVPPDLFHAYIIGFDEVWPVLDVLDDFTKYSFIRNVQPDALHRVFRAPNDPLWQQQWDKRIMHADGVWDVTFGSRKIICAGIDTGVDWNHPDLATSLWVNPGEDLDGDGVAWTWDQYPGDPDDFNDTDDDHDGYVDDFLGWDFLVGITGCDSREDCDDHNDNNMFGINSHGTHVAGIMAAAGNNSIGVAGVNWNAALMALRAGYQNPAGHGFIPESASIPAILFAAAHGANVINMSYGGPGYSESAQQAINSAWEQGCLLVAASGNDGSTDLHYPAAYENVIAVNATDSQDRLASWSNRGTWSDICAPGSDPGIISTVINSYDTYWGTSMASPNAAGVAALLWSLFPDYSNAQVRDLLFSGAVDIRSRNSGVPPAHLGHGRVDALQSVVSLCPNMNVTSFELSDAVQGDGDGRLERSETAALVLHCTNVSGWSAAANVLMSVISDDPWISIANESVQLGNVAAGQSVSNEGSPVLLTASGYLVQSVKSNLQIKFESASGCEIVRSISIVTGRGRVLLVDDDHGAEYESYFANALQDKNIAADQWHVLLDGEVGLADLREYPIVLWTCGNALSATLTPADQSHLSAYLDRGGQLILVGQNIDEDIRASAFYSGYLHVQSAQTSGDQRLYGVAGNSVTEGMTLLLRGSACGDNGQVSPSVLVPIGDAVPMFTYSQGGVGAVQYAGAYKVAYFAFALESACGLENSTRYPDVLVSLLDWMNPTDNIPVQSVSTPQSVRLCGNYPNPFNAATTLHFDLAAPGQVSLKIFDVLGRTAATLVNGPMPSGSFQMSFNASNLSSGVYIARLETGVKSASVKMMLVK